MSLNPTAVHGIVVGPSKIEKGIHEFKIGMLKYIDSEGKEVK